MGRGERAVVLAMCAVLLFPSDWMLLRAQEPIAAEQTVEQTKETAQQVLPETAPPALAQDSTVYLDAKLEVANPYFEGEEREESDDEEPTEVVADDYPYGLDGKKIFNPSPQRAIWLSALCPGLGQIYNRRYWKLPIVVGGFMGLGYAASWNNSQYADYTQGYRDLVDSDPTTNSYMNFFPPTVSETDFDRTWLQQTFKSRRDYYRRNRDLCIICLVALYLVCIVDAYVDASMAHFDITPDLALDVAPAIWQPRGGDGAALGLNWALTF